MNLVTLQTFLSILETGSLARAAKRLHVSQSTVTARLQKLEEEIGQSLFHRHKSGVLLTASGLKFRRYAEAMTDLWQQARQETSMPEGIDAVCNLGSEFDLWPILGRHLLARIHREYPLTALSAWPGKHNELEQWLATGLIDAALAFQPISQDHLSSHELGSETLVLVSTRAGSPARSDPGYIYVDAGQDFGRRHAAAYTDAGIAKVSFGCSVWALEFLLDRGGSAYLPKSIAAPGLAAGKLHLIADTPVFTRHTYLICNDRVAQAWPWLTRLGDWFDQARGITASQASRKAIRGTPRSR